MVTPKFIEQIKLAVEKEPEIIAVYVFGSAVKRYMGAESDLDIALVVKHKNSISEDKLYHLIQHIHFPKEPDLSIVDLHSSPLFLYQIISSGKRIYAHDELEANIFESNVLKRYYDTAHLRSIYYHYLKDKFSQPLYAHK